jgi:chloramphenicol-sensitive protein RarD
VSASEAEIRRAAAAGLTAYLIWGVSPLYFQLLSFARPEEIVFHRVVWSVPMLLGLLFMAKRLETLKPIFADTRTLMTLAATAVLIAINWFVFIYAVNTQQVLQASLGYYLNPLMSVAVGVFALREPLGPRRIIAIGLASAGVINQIITVGELPWITLVLAVSFTAYGYLRKTVAADGRAGLFIETLFVLPFALIGIYWLESSGQGGVFGDPVRIGLLALAGVVTVVPLLLYTIGARGLRLSTMGVMQFIAPSLQFLIAVASGEAFTYAHAITFALIWSGVAVFVWSQLKRDPTARSRPA